MLHLVLNNQIRELSIQVETLIEMKVFLKKILLRLFEFAKEESKRQRYDQFRRNYNIDKSFKFNGHEIQLYGEGKISLGAHSYIGRNSTIQAEKNCQVSIGCYCAISHYVKIYTTAYQVDQNFINKVRQTKSASVVIGDGVWIGSNVLINPGVTVGSNSVIGANSVVTKDVQSNSIVSGVPAVFLRYKNLNE